jgi:hypothetical protein
VLGFLAANVSSLPDHNAAKGFLTPEARNTWLDSPVTVVDAYQVKLPDPSTHVVTVTANQVGTIDQNGIYRTVQQADSGIQRSFGMKRLNGQWRIDKLSPGLVIQLTDFGAYRMHPLYYFDLIQKHLVPDPRYTPLSDQSLATWLLDQLLSQPRPELQLAVLSIPNAVNAKNATVTVDATSQVYVVELPGSSRLDKNSRRRLATQVAFTFNNALITITDNRRPVSIPGITGPFSETDFQSASGVFHDRPAYYVTDAGVVADQTGKVLDGFLGHRSYGLTSISRRRSGCFRSPGGGRGWIVRPVHPADWVAQGGSARCAPSRRTDEPTGLGSRAIGGLAGIWHDPAARAHVRHAEPGHNHRPRQSDWPHHFRPVQSRRDSDRACDRRCCTRRAMRDWHGRAQCLECAHRQSGSGHPL